MIKFPTEPKKKTLSGSQFEIPWSWQQRIKIHKLSLKRITRHLDSNLISDLSNYTLRQLILCPGADTIIVSIQLLFAFLMNSIPPKFQLFACSDHLPRLWSQHFPITHCFPALTFSSETSRSPSPIISYRSMAALFSRTNSLKPTWFHYCLFAH